MTAFYTDNNGNVRVIPDGDPNYKPSGNKVFRASASKQQKGGNPKNQGGGQGSKPTSSSSGNNASSGWVETALKALGQVVVPVAQAATKAVQPTKAPKPLAPSPSSVSKASPTPQQVGMPKAPTPVPIELDIPYDSSYQQPSTYKSNIIEAPDLPSPKALKYQQQLIERAMGANVFDQADKQDPYEYVPQGQSSVTGQPVVERQVARDIQRTTAMVRHIVFGDRGSTLTPQQLQELRQKVIHESFTPEEKRLLKLAGTIHHMINENEALGLKKRNDALLVARVIQLIANNSLNENARLDRELFKKTVADFFIDQTHNNLPSTYAAIGAWYLHKVGESNLAYNTMGGPRVLSYGWDPALYDVQGEPQHNQAHHLAAFIIAGMEDVNYQEQSIAELESKAIDNNPLYKNKNDYKLSQKAIELGRELSLHPHALKDLEKAIYNQIRSKT